MTHQDACARLVIGFLQKQKRLRTSPLQSKPSTLFDGKSVATTTYNALHHAEHAPSVGAIDAPPNISAASERAYDQYLCAAELILATT